MSRVAKNPIPVPKGVELKVGGGQISVKGPLGAVVFSENPQVKIERDGERVLCMPVGESTAADALAGTLRAIVANMVIGVTKGFERKLSLVGVGYRAQAQGDKLNLSLGFSHPVVYQMPKGVKVATPTQTEIVISGIDRQQVGQVAAEVRAFRPPEPYKGKGVRYSDEVVLLKETKKK